MRLRRLLAAAGLGGAQTEGTPGDPEVTSLTLDSRAVIPGALYACVPGSAADGHVYAPAAVASGAVALLVERPLPLPVAQVVVPSVRVALGPLAAAFHGEPSRSLTVVGVTGTNGKTTTVSLLASIFAAHGWDATTIGTLTQARTTPEAPALQERLAGALDEGVRAVAMEVSSHALVQHRVDGVHFAAAVLTNVTQDHLDYHGTMEAYFDAKAMLFEPGRSDVAVVNGDDPWGRRLLGRLGAGDPTVAVFSDADASDVRLGPDGSAFTWRGTAMHLALAGRFNIRNALAAATCAEAVGVDRAAVAEGLRRVVAVPGRFQRVDSGQGFTVLVDYAHTPDGLRAALSSARELGGGRLLVVFGAGGDRDREKRPLMGSVAAALADLTIVTSDNPRREDPRSIIDEVIGGVDPSRRSRVSVQEDRRAAIGDAIALAGPGDVVVVAGKGHEGGQDFGDRIEPFDDVAEVAEALRRVERSRRQLP